MPHLVSRGRGDTPPPPPQLVDHSTTYPKLSYYKIFYMLLSHEIGSSSSTLTRACALDPLGTYRRSPEPSPILRLPTLKLDPPLARSHPQHAWCHPFVCRKRRLNGTILRMRPSVTAGVALRSLHAQRRWVPSILEGLILPSRHRNYLKIWFLFFFKLYELWRVKKNVRLNFFWQGHPPPPRKFLDPRLEGVGLPLLHLYLFVFI
jgi:hypothetical protein